jgi:hypothetical protein
MPRRRSCTAELSVSIPSFIDNEEPGRLRLRKRTIRIVCQIRRAPNIKSSYERGTIYNVRP